MKSWQIINLVFLFSFLGCDLIKMKDEEKNNKENLNVVARVENQFLYLEDLKVISTEGLSAEDSIDRVMIFIDGWIKKQLLIREASSKIVFDMAEIERKMLDYRYSLMGYEYKLYYINKNLDIEVSDQEIKNYYEKNIDNFVLKQNIVSGRYIKLPINAPKIDRVKRLILSNQPDDIEELNSYALSFAVNYQLNDSVWMVFDEMTKNSPFAEIPNKVQFLKKKEYVELEDDQFKYFFKLNKYRISDNISPLEFVREDIKNIIINKRKVLLTKQLEKKIYEKAANEKTFEIY